jgi:hypothetical protein
LTILWTNLHGGFAILPVYLCILAAGSLAEQKFRAAKRYALLTVLCAAASLVNPYGIKLHLHIARFLGSSWLANMVQEYAPVTTSHGDDRVYCYFGLLACAVVASAWLLWKRRYVEPVWLAVLGYAAFHSTRHIPIFVIAAVPILAAVFSRIWVAYVERLKPSSTARVIHSIFESMTPQFKRVSAWSLVVLSLIFFSDLPAEFPRDGYPTALILRNHTLLAQSRLYSTDHWSDYLVYRYYPQQRVFVDGRSDFYGQAIGEDYLSVLEADPNWKEIMARWRFDAVLVPEKSRIAKAIGASAEWRAVDRDNQSGAVLFLPVNRSFSAPLGG